jgi:hypothetical protein
VSVGPEGGQGPQPGQPGSWPSPPGNTPQWQQPGRPPPAGGGRPPPPGPGGWRFTINASQTFNATVNSAGDVSNLLTKLTQEQQAG